MKRTLSTLLVAGAAILGIVLGGAFGANNTSAADNVTVSAGSQWG